MKFLRNGIVLCFCFALMNAKAQERTKYSQVKIFVTKDRVAALQQAGLDIDHAYYNRADQSLSTTLDEKEVAKLATLGLRYKITTDDVQAEFLKQNKLEEFFKYDNSRNAGGAAQRLLFNNPDKSFLGAIVTPAAFNAGSMGGYLTFAEMKKELDSMALNYPGLVKLDSIGRTYENRAIWAVTISDNPGVNENEPEILFTGMHHAREPLAMENLIFFMQYLLENYATNSSIKEIVNSRSLVFIPCLNPDGYVYNQSTDPAGGGLWRKNRQPNADAANPGQDLNRNYSYGFDYNNSGSSDVPSAVNYHGDYPMQAYETQIIRTFLRQHNFMFAINYHSYGGYWIHGNTVPTYTLSHADSLVIKTTGAMATRNSFYTVGTPMETVGYNGNGTIEDFCMRGDSVMRPNPVYCISPEVGAGLTTFWPAANTIIGYCKETLYGNLQAALFGGAYADVDEKTNMVLTSKNPTLSFLVSRIGRADSSVKITVTPLENATAGGTATVASLPQFLSQATLNIGVTLHPNITNGQRVRFVVKTETGGITKLDTLVKFYSTASLSLFSDDMEGASFSSKWTSASWGYSTAYALNGAKSLAESPSGNYPSNTTTTINTATNLNLTGATAAYLSFWTRYKTQTGYDKLQIKVSTDGTNYTALPGTHTVLENKGTLANQPALTGVQEYWVRETVDLKSVLGNAAVRIRFEFSSDANAVVNDGFFLDDVDVVRSTAALVALPVKFMDVKAVKTGSEVAIKWEAAIDADHLRFEVERSTDGQRFEAIYTTTEKGSVFFATDAKPATGTNYYRIKAVSNGGAQYSQTVPVNFANNGNIGIYPNPVEGQLKVTISGQPNGRYQFVVIGASGSVVLYSEADVTSTQAVNINTRGLAAGVYRLCIRKADGELVDVKTFSKM